MIRHHALLEPLIERVHVFAERPLWLLTADPRPAIEGLDNPKRSQT